MSRGSGRRGKFVKSSTIEFPTITDSARRNLALKEARFKLLTKRMCRVNHLIATQSLLQENEGLCCDFHKIKYH